MGYWGAKGYVKILGGGHAPLPLPMPMQGQITDSFDQIASGISLTEV